MRDFNVLDIETYNNNGKFIPYCICLILKGKKISIYGKDVVKQLISLFEKYKINDTIYAHNLTFDGSIIIENIQENIKINGILFRSNIYELKIESPKFKVILKCSYKMFPMSLNKIGNLLKIKTNKMEFPHDFANEKNLYYIGDHPKNKNIKNWNFKENAINYCFNDCLITKKMVEEIVSSMDKNEKETFEKSRSVSSLSLNIYKDKFNIFELETKLSSDNDKILREGFYGGRCEVFGNKYPEEKVFHFDFSGMYAEVMKEDFYFNNASITKANNVENGGFYKVDVLSKGMNIPVLPFRERKDNKLIFPNGRWTGTYWFEELKLFQEEGGEILKIHYKINLEKKEKLFKNFVENYKKLRKNSELDNIFWKLFINSIYGRLGMDQSNERTEIIHNDEEYLKIRKTKEILKESIINKIRIITFENEEKNKEVDSNVSIAAQITSKARIKLYKGFKDVIKNNGRILYTDTDSIFAGFKENVLNQKHGEVFWDGNKDDTEIKNAIFALPKGYAVITENNKETIKIKGFKRNSISFEEFEETFNNDNELTLKEINFKKSNFTLKFEEIEKKIQLNSYDKRIFTDNKRKTIALNIDDIY